MERSGDSFTQPAAAQLLSEAGAVMSGFLQRLTSSAIRRQTSLHPLVGPVYAAARRDETPASQFPEETQTVVFRPSENTSARAQSPVSTASQTASFQPFTPDSAQLQNARGVRSDTTHENAAANSAANHSSRRADSSGIENSVLSFMDSGAFHPLLARSSDSHRESRSGSESLSEETVADFASGKNAADEPSRGFNSASDSMAKTPAGSQPWQYEPLLPAGTPMPSHSAEAAQGPRPSEQARFTPDLQAASQRAAANDALTRRNAADAMAARMRAPIQPEDIQIHIGRIEVIAVPPPAPRPAPTSQRRGQSLDEYLSRSNGRSR
jgi:hypothetical protein